MSAYEEHVPSLTHKVVKNTVYNTIGRFWSIIVGIFLAPYVIHRLGVERFGVWAIIGVVTGYFGLLDFGIGFSFVKYIAEFYTKKEYGEVSRVVNTGFVLYSMLALIGTGLVLIFKTQLLTLLNVPLYLWHEAAVILIIGIALFGASNAISPFGAVQGGLQRMDISNNISIAVSIVNIAGTVFVLERGYGLIGLMLNNVAVFFVTATINMIVAFKLLPELQFRPIGFSMATCRRLLRFGSNTQIAKVAGMIVNQMDKIYITSLLSIGLVTFYQLGSSVIYYASSLAAILTSAIMPAFSEIEAKGERSRLIEAYVRSIKYLSFFVLPLFAFLIISAFQVINIWMGPGYEKTGLIIQILAFTWIVPTIAQVSVYVSFAIDRPQFMARGSIIIMVLNLVLGFIFIKRFGFYGAAWGALVAMNVGTLYFLSKLHKYLSIPFAVIIRTILPYAGVAALAALIILFGDHFMAGFYRDQGRIPMLCILAGRGLVFVLLFIFGVSRFRLLNYNDIEFFHKRMPFVWNILKRFIAA